MMSNKILAFFCRLIRFYSITGTLKIKAVLKLNQYCMCVDFSYAF